MGTQWNSKELRNWLLGFNLGRVHWYLLYYSSNFTYMFYIFVSHTFISQLKKILTEFWFWIKWSKHNWLGVPH